MMKDGRFFDLFMFLCITARMRMQTFTEGAAEQLESIDTNGSGGTSVATVERVKHSKFSRDGTGHKSDGGRF
jgi:hypothetical protein